MKLTKMKPLLALAVIAMALGCMTTARAQYIVTGTTPGGGNIVVGSGVLGTTFSGDGFLTNNGSDNLTISLGSFATSTNGLWGGVINFTTSNNTFTNFGTITGTTEGAEDDVSGVAVSFENFNEEGLANENIVNHGNIFGGENDDDQIISTGISLIAGGTVQNISITNTGLVEGASNSFNAEVAGTALSIVAEEENISGVTILNSGNLIGGNENDDAFVMSAGISLLAGNGITNVSITNTQGGNILGGSENVNFGGEEDTTVSIGNAISIIDENFSGANIDTVSIANSGNIIGGNLNNDESDEFDSGYFLGNGIAIGGLGDVSNINITNSSTGVIQGGNDNDEGFFVGSGIAIGAVGQDLDNGALNNVTIGNSGLIQGGHGNEGDERGVEAGVGLAFASSNSISNVTINNYASGIIRGGDSNFDAEGGAGSAIDFDAGAEVESSIVQAIDINEFGITNVTINNWGLISGGNGNDFAEFAGVGIGMDGETISGVTINNALGATITGGNGNFEESFDSGAGISFDAEGIDGVTINNLGLISGGSDITGTDEGADSGDGIDMNAEFISNATINNGFTGVITGGVGGGAGIVIDTGGGENVTINNLGFILGGDGDNIEDNTEGGAAIVLESDEGGMNSTVNNYGWIIGGNGTDGDGGGAGVVVEGGNATINNWGIISGGLGSGEVEGFVSNAISPNFTLPENLADAIVISGSGNVVNLNGHSAVFGKITVSGPANSNVVNLNFTGLSPADIAALTPILQGQGVNSGTDSPSVVFTVRGVTYDIDPVIVNGHLLSYQLQGVTPNQSSVGSALDSAKVNPPPGTPLFLLYNAIDQSGNVPASLELLSPQVFQIYGDIALANANFNTLEIDHRLNNLRDGSEGIDVTGMENTMGITSGLSKDDAKESKTIVTPAPENRWGFFASGNAIFTNIDAHGGDIQDSGFTTEGLLVGLDGKINEHWLVGTFFNYEHTDADLDNVGSKANVDSYGGGLYAGYHNAGYYANGLFDYTHNDYESHRNIAIPGFNQVASASPSGNQFEFNIDGGYDIHLNDRFTWGPILGLQYVHMDVDSFSETGAPAANLAVGSQSMDSLRSRMGVRLDYHKQVSQHMSFATEVRAEWQHEFLDDSRSINAGFIGDGLIPFSVRTTSPQRDAALVGVGANLTVRDKYTFFFDYDVQAGQQSYLEQSVKGGLKISW